MVGRQWHTISRTRIKMDVEPTPATPTSPGLDPDVVAFILDFENEVVTEGVKLKREFDITIWTGIF